MVVEVLKALVTVLKALYDYIQSSSPMSPGNLLKNQVLGLERGLVLLRHQVEDVTYELRRGEVIDLNRDVAAQNANVAAALQFADEHPGDDSAEIPALSAALALANPYFYIFPGRTPKSPDRFDPRSALPAFLQAVNAWLSIRNANGASWTPSSRRNLLDIATALETIVQQILASIEAVEVYKSADIVIRPKNPPRIPPRPRDPDEPPAQPELVPVCNHYIIYTDRIRETVEYNPFRQVVGSHCDSDSTIFLPAETQVYVETNYATAMLTQIVAKWRSLV